MVSIDEDRCTLCGLCIRVCLKGVLKEEEENIVVTDPASCNLCGHCKAVCPADAPKFSGLNENEFEPTPDIDQLPDPVVFLRFLRHRRNQRIYKNKPVEIEKIKMIIEAGRFAPREEPSGLRVYRDYGKEGFGPSMHPNHPDSAGAREIGERRLGPIPSVKRTHP